MKRIAVPILIVLCGVVSLALADESSLLKDRPTPPATEPASMTPDQMHAAGERATAAAAKLGWRIGVQSWTFNRRSFFQAIDAVHSLGLHFIEAYPGQKIDADPKVTFGPALSAEVREQIKKSWPMPM